jgi:mRNA interferase MazF
MAVFLRGDVVLAWLVFSDRQGSKRRPVLVVHDFGDDDLLVVPVTSHATRIASDLVVSQWSKAGLRLPSIIRVAKLATLDKSCVERQLGRLAAEDLAKFGQTLAIVCQEIVA